MKTKKGDKVKIVKTSKGVDEKFTGRTGTVTALNNQQGILFANIKLDMQKDEQQPVTLLNVRYFEQVKPKAAKK